MAIKDRRRAKRIDANLSVVVFGGPERAIGETINISTNGVCFNSPYFIEPLTKVQLNLIIPDEKGSKKDIPTDGVVVRVEPEREDPSISQYKIAVFFNKMSVRSHQELESFIMQLSKV